MRKLFYEDVLTNDKFRKGKNIDWINSIGKSVHFIYDDIEDDIIIIDYDKKKSIVTYNYHNITYEQPSTSLKNCRLGKMLFYNFKYNVGDILNNKDKNQSIQIIDRQITKRNNQKVKIYKYKCLKCEFEGEKIERDLNRTWCPCCCPTPKVVKEGVNDIPTIAPWMIKYFQGGYDEAKLYNCNSMQKIYPICPICNKVKERPISIYQIYSTKSIGCNCNDGVSYPNKIMYSILNQLNIEFMTEYTTNWLKSCRFDFYVPNLMLFIEMDGGLGHGKSIFNLSKLSLSEQEIEIKKNETLKKDNFKDKAALEHGYKVIRINCDISEINYIKNNLLNSDLANYFDLSTIDWKKCDEYALKNIIKEVCNYYKQNMNATYESVANEFHLSKCTIGRYLKKGVKVEWITESEYKDILRNNKKRKPTYVYDLNFNLLDKFSSASDLVKNSKNKFGIQFSSGGITKAVKKRTKYYGKYYISYSNLTEEEFLNMLN